MHEELKMRPDTTPEHMLEHAGFLLRLAAKRGQAEAELLRLAAAVLYDAADALSRSGRLPEVAELAADDLLRAGALAVHATRFDQPLDGRHSALRTAQHFISLANYRVLIAKRATGTDRR